MKKSLNHLFAIFLCCLFFACKKEEPAAPDALVFQASGNIESVVNEFRNKLGPLNTAPGATGGRREINWEGVPDNQLHVFLPGNFFNLTGTGAPAAQQRGLAYAPNELQVSNNAFTAINEEAAKEFAAFSGSKTFANLSRNAWEIGFEVPGETVAARVRGFGMVFSDVDLPQSTAIEFFDGTQSLGKFFVPPHNAGSSFSFLGVYFNRQQVSRIKISHQGIVSSNAKDVSRGGTDDLVLVDDLIYSEPVRQ